MTRPQEVLSRYVLGLLVLFSVGCWINESNIHCNSDNDCQRGWSCGPAAVCVKAGDGASRRDGAADRSISDRSVGTDVKGDAGIDALAACTAVNLAIATQNLIACSRLPPDELTDFTGRNSYHCQGLAKAVTAGIVTYDPSQLSACLAAINSTSCPFMYPPICAGLFTGTKPVGATCDGLSECTAGNYCQGCDLFSGGASGVCAAYLRSGQVCSSGQFCSAGLVCARPPGPDGDGGMVCQSPGVAGASCGPGSGAGCGFELYCDRATLVCKPQLTSGTCDPSQPQCALGYVCQHASLTCMKAVSKGATCFPRGNECALGLYCDGATKTCLEWGHVGEGCGTMGTGEFRPCLPDAFCKMGDAGVSSTCDPLLSPGTSCGSIFSAFECSVGTTCMAGVCAATACY